eukprot:762540-Hanusia_phi.AAC.1
MCEYTNERRKEVLIEYSVKFSNLGLNVIPLVLSKNLFKGLTEPYEEYETIKRLYKKTEGKGYKQAINELRSKHGTGWTKWNKGIEYTIDYIKENDVSGLAIVGEALRIDDDTYKNPEKVPKEVKDMLEELYEKATVVVHSGEGKCCIPEAPTGLIPDVVTCLA